MGEQLHTKCYGARLQRPTGNIRKRFRMQRKPLFRFPKTTWSSRCKRWTRWDIEVCRWCPRQNGRQAVTIVGRGRLSFCASPSKDMARYSNSVMGFPPFRGAVRVIILASLAIYVVILLLVSFAPTTGNALLHWGILDPELVRQGKLWQLV